MTGGPYIIYNLKWNLMFSPVDELHDESPSSFSLFATLHDDSFAALSSVDHIH